MPAHEKIKKAVIPAAGFGTRMLPATKALPKEMLPVAGKPLIQFAVEEAVQSGIETIILVTRSHKSLIQAHFSRDRELESFLEDRRQVAAAELVRRLAEFGDLKYVEQEKPLGLAHAISCARPLVGEEPFVVLLPDVIMTSAEPVTHQLIRVYGRDRGSIVAIREIELHEVERHGIVRASDTNGSGNNAIRLTELVEKPSLAEAPSRLGVFGRYLLEPYIWDAIVKTDRGAAGEVQLTDALNLLSRERAVFGVFFEGQHFDAGDRMGYLKANIELSLQDTQQPLRTYLSSLLSRTGHMQAANGADNGHSCISKTQRTSPKA